MEPGTSTPTPTLANPSSSASAGACAAGHAEVTVAPGGAPGQRLCVRPGTVVSLILEPRSDDKRWVAVHSSAPVLVVTSGWRVEGDGSARAALRCAGTRGGTAEVTALAKAPDVAGAARVAFTLEVSVVPHTTER
ncbi:acetyl-CoA synthetase [Streptomyces sp. NPDC048751]|uniref:acetyl-CoA synthetase n=1 Tax=Streptomyces sp. NPDC048751 TaxID=3365591 RepID=UPI003715E7C9